MIIKIGPYLRTGGIDVNVWKNYYSLEKDSLDMVAIGSSALYRYWIPAQAYDEQGFTSTMIYGGGQDIDTVPYLIEEALKTQHPKVIVVETRRLIQEMFRRQQKGDRFDDERFDSFTGSMISTMHLNAVKAEIINNVMTRPLVQKFEYLFPLLQYHANVYQYSLEEILQRQERDTITMMTALPISKAAKKKLTKLDEKDLPEVEMPDGVFDILDRIAETAAKHGTEVLFIATPYGINPAGQTVRKAMDDYMEEKGYPYLDMVPLAVDEIGLDFETDFYNKFHTNVAGAEKVTSFLGQYLTDNYQFETSLSEEGKAYWDRFVKYHKKKMKSRKKSWKKKVAKMREEVIL